jgi:hypothetical protein
VKEHDFEEEDVDVKKYESRYRDEYATEPELMKAALAKVVIHPGYGLQEILSGRLLHMVHVDCTTSHSGKSMVYEYAEFSYLLDFRARELRVLNEKKWNGLGTWSNVPLLNNEGSILLDFKILNNVDREKIERRLEEGPEYMARPRKEKYGG